MEPGPRAYETCVMLADAYHNDSLFSLDDIKWAFVRPRLPGDRSKAYAQGHWMVEYMNERFGESTLVRLLERYFHGEREQQAIPAALGISREQFYTDFLEWARHEVDSWGLGSKPTMVELTDEIRMADPEKSIVMSASKQARLDAIVNRLTEQVGQPATRSPGDDPRAGQLTGDQWPDLVRPPVDISDEQLAKWIDQYPDHPDLAELQLRRRIQRAGENISANDDALIELLNRYAALRPVDPYPHKKLAQIWLASQTPGKAIPHLEYLDIREEKSPAYAVQLAKLYREAGDLDAALTKAVRALHINPYNAPNRELAATIALEAKRYDAARQHIFALTLLEPDRPQHVRRLEAVEKLMKSAG